MTETALGELLAAPLGNLDLVALMIDGVHFGEHLCVVALGIGIDGTKHPLGLVEGSTENTTVVTDLLTDLLGTVSTALDMGLFFAAFRLATAKVVPTRDLLLGAILSSIAWQILLSLAGLIIGRDLKHAQAVAGFFGVVLGLLAWFGLQATATIYAAEVDVVRARHLWPRSITQPPLTSADKRFLQDAAEEQTRRPEQKVTVEFTPQADHDPLHPTPETPRDTPVS